LQPQRPRRERQGRLVNAQGWALPTVGVITSPWGYRYDPAAGYSWRMHYGDDIAHGCLQPIYAAHAGTVTYAGPYGDIGNYITINDGDGIATPTATSRTARRSCATANTWRRSEHRAHRLDRTSTGCHLYFQVLVNGDPVNPVPFMRDRGIILG